MKYTRAVHKKTLQAKQHIHHCAFLPSPVSSASTAVRVEQSQAESPVSQMSQMVSTLFQPKKRMWKDIFKDEKLPTKSASQKFKLKNSKLQNKRAGSNCLSSLVSAKLQVEQNILKDTQVFASIPDFFKIQKRGKAENQDYETDTDQLKKDIQRNRTQLKQGIADLKKLKYKKRRFVNMRDPCQFHQYNDYSSDREEYWL